MRFRLFTIIAGAIGAIAITSCIGVGPGISDGYNYANTDGTPPPGPTPTSSASNLSNPWTWIAGSSSVGQPGAYPSPVGASGPSTTYYPGQRQGASTWTDHSGNFWLFGGSNSSGSLNDLWEYTPSSNTWTWVAGSSSVNQVANYPAVGESGSSATYYPGARENSATWVDTSGNLWLLGGYGYASESNPGSLNDFWKYSPSANTWTFIAGSNANNITGAYPGTLGTSGPPTLYWPGARYGASTWVDTSGNLWLFGGNGEGNSTAGDLDDLWEYSVANNTWTWVAGQLAVNDPGAYPAAVGGSGSSTTFYPGGRYYASAWVDQSGNFWLFGGTGYAATSNGSLNDLWKYNIASNTWTWASGSNSADQIGNYPPEVGGTGSSATYYPGARELASSWVDLSGNLWLYAGDGYGSTTTSTGYLNDFWEYSVAASTWTWFSGSNQPNQNGQYPSSPGESGPNIYPGGRDGTATWIDSSGNVWLYGGYGVGASGNTGDMDDLWKFAPNL